MLSCCCFEPFRLLPFQRNIYQVKQYCMTGQQGKRSTNNSNVSSPVQPERSVSHAGRLVSLSWWDFPNIMMFIEVSVSVYTFLRKPRCQEISLAGRHQFSFCDINWGQCGITIVQIHSSQMKEKLDRLVNKENQQHVQEVSSMQVRRYFYVCLFSLLLVVFL